MSKQRVKQKHQIIKDKKQKMQQYFIDSNKINGGTTLKRSLCSWKDTSGKKRGQFNTALIATLSKTY
jgi:hypothetical protein